MGEKKIVDVDTTEDFDNIFVNDGKKLKQTEKTRLKEILGMNIANGIIFKGEDTTSNILAKSYPSVGDKWYSTDENVYYMYSQNGWINVGSGEDYYQIKEQLRLLSEESTELKGDIDNVVDVSGLLMQYIDSSKWINKFYFGWNVEHTKPQLNPVDDVLWNCVKIENIPKGTYYYNYAYPQFCFIENRQNGDVVDCSSILVDADGIENNFTVDYDFDLYLTVAKNPISNLAMLCSGIIPNHFVDIGYYSLRDFTVNNKSILTVGKGEKYETIQSACDVANYDDIIFIKCGVYTENVKLWGKRVHLVGQDKLNTILIDHTGNYQTPPLEMSDGSVSNITIIQDNSNPTGTEGDGKYGNSYCIHADWLPVRASNIFEIDNCILINKVWACIGIGLQADYTVRIRNTQMIGESSQPVPTLFCHDSAQDYNYLQYLIVQNCMISSKGGKCVQIDKTTAEGGEAWYQFDGCTIYDENLGSINDIITLTSADNFKKHRSYGNTVQLLNN